MSTGSSSIGETKAFGTQKEEPFVVTELRFEWFAVVALPTNALANGPALSLGGSSNVSNTLADVMGVRYDVRAPSDRREKKLSQQYQ